MKRALLVLVVVACEKDQPEKLEAPPTTPSLAPAPIPPPPPPPAPPPAPTNVPPPSQIADFLRAHEHDEGPWRVQFRVGKRSAWLAQADASDLVTRLSKDTAYLDGDSGCVETPLLHIELARGAAALPLDVDCDHLYLSPRGHEGPWVLLSRDMLGVVRGLRARVLPSG